MFRTHDLDDVAIIKSHVFAVQDALSDLEDVLHGELRPKNADVLAEKVERLKGDVDEVKTVVLMEAHKS